MNRKAKEPSMGMRSDQALASNGIDPDVRREILRRLAVIESEEEVRIALRPATGTPMAPDGYKTMNPTTRHELRPGQ